MDLEARRGAGFPQELDDLTLRGGPKTQVPTEQPGPFEQAAGERLEEPAGRPFLSGLRGGRGPIGGSLLLGCPLQGLLKLGRFFFDLTGSLPKRLGRTSDPVLERVFHLLQIVMKSRPFRLQFLGQGPGEIIMFLPDRLIELVDFLV